MAALRVAIAGITRGPGHVAGSYAIENSCIECAEELLTDATYDFGGACDALGVEPVPILAATGTAPGGSIELTAYMHQSNEMLVGLRQAGEPDRVCLLLKGR